MQNILAISVNGQIYELDNKMMILLIATSSEIC